MLVSTKRCDGINCRTGKITLKFNYLFSSKIARTWPFLSETEHLQLCLWSRKKNINKQVQGFQEDDPISGLVQAIAPKYFLITILGKYWRKTSEIDSLILFHKKRVLVGREEGRRELNLGRAPNFLDPVIEDNFLLFFLGPHYHPKYISLTRLWWRHDDCCFAILRNLSFSSDLLNELSGPYYPLLRERRWCIFISSGQ